jgi:hypothetical protein
MHKSHKPIETQQEFEEIVQRIKELATALPGSPEEEEINRLLDSADKWRRDHAPMPAGIKPTGA